MLNYILPLAKHHKLPFLLGLCTQDFGVETLSKSKIHLSELQLKTNLSCKLFFFFSCCTFGKRSYDKTSGFDWWQRKCTIYALISISFVQTFNFSYNQRVTVDLSFAVYNILLAQIDNCIQYGEDADVKIKDFDPEDDDQIYR